MAEAPHEVLGKAIVSGIEGMQAIGHSAVTVLDTLPEKAEAPKFPHHVVNNAADTVANTVKGLIKKLSGI